MDKDCGNCSSWANSTQSPFGLCSISAKKGLINKGGSCDKWSANKTHPDYISAGIDEIRENIAERDTLKAENARLREALEKIAQHDGCEDYYHHYCGCGDQLEDIAFKALEDSQ